MFRKMASLALVSIAAVTIGGSANAAINVLGGSIAHSCYEAAEFGGNPNDGIKTCTAALEEEALSLKDRAATMINLGILRSQNDDPEGALATYNQGLELDPTLGEGYVDRGAAEIVLKKYKVAVADITKGISLNANRLEIAYYDRAIADEALGDIKGAYLDYKKAVELSPDFALANQQLMRFKVVRRTVNGT